MLPAPRPPEKENLEVGVRNIGQKATIQYKRRMGACAATFAPISNSDLYPRRANETKDVYSFMGERITLYLPGSLI